jgi:hypothetical protein
MSPRHRALKVRKRRGAGAKAKKIPPGMFLGCIVNTVARDVHALLTGEPSLLGDVWESLRLLGENTLC